MTEDHNTQLRQMLSEQDERIAHLQRRLEDQEHSIRHVLTMLIEWAEAQGSR